MLSKPLVGLESIFYHSKKDVIFMLRTRTIREAAAYFQENDPQTCLTETAIRTLLRTGVVPSARVGRKYLVTIEALEAYLGGSLKPEKPVKAQSKK